MARAAVLITGIKGGPDSETCIVSFDIACQANMSVETLLNLSDPSSVQQATIRQAAVDELTRFGQLNNGFPVFSTSDITLLFNIV